MSDTRETAALWAAVNALTQPTRVPVPRDHDRAAVAELEANWAKLRARTKGACDVAAHHREVAAYHAATRQWATIPSLWDQSTDALTSGTEGGGGKPLRERSPADLDLMEIRGLIRDTTRHELEARGTKTRQGDDGERVPFDQAEMRSLASLVIQKNPGDLWWWTYRFESWGRLLETYLQAAERKAKPMRLRGASCPRCTAARVVIESDTGPMVVPALVIDFTADGYARACECLNCGAAFWRGAQLDELAATLRHPGNPAC